MWFSEFDWQLALQRAAYILALWVGLWLLRRIVVIRIPKLVARVESLEFDGRDVRIFTRFIDVSCLLIGVMVTLLILGLAPWLAIGAVGSRLIALVFLWLLVWLLYRYLHVWIRAFDQHLFSIQLDERDITALEQLLGIALFLVAVIITLAILGLTSLLYSALTAAGVLGIIVGFAVKDIAANFISGIFILFDRPFVVGDAIQVKDIAGTVSKLSLRSTQLVTLDGPAVTIPNSMVATEPTTNFTMSRFRRIQFAVSVSSADLHHTIQIIQDTLDAEPRLLGDLPAAIYVEKIRDYVTDLQIVAFSSNQDYVDTQSDLKRAITEAFALHGVDLAIPIRVCVAETSAAHGGAGPWPVCGAVEQQESQRHPKRPLPD